MSKISKRAITTLVIAIFILSTIAGLAVPTTMASTPIIVDNFLSWENTGVSCWTAADKHSGAFSVKLHSHHNAWDDWAEFTFIIPVDLTLEEIDILKFWQKMSVADVDPYGSIFIQLKMDYDGDGKYDEDGSDDRYLTREDDGLGGPDAWTEIDAFTVNWWLRDGANAHYEGDAETIGDSPYQSLDLWQANEALKDKKILYVVLGHGGASSTILDAYADDLTINDVTYDLEPQSLTVGQFYDISWTACAREQPSKSVTLEYYPEDDAYPADIDITSITSTEGAVNFYNVIPHYAGNWTLSDLTDVTVPPGDLDRNDLVRMGYASDSVFGSNVYFVVQPAEDLDVAVSPSAFDVESGTMAITITVTDEGEPVGDAYVSVEFWDNEATKLYTDDTALLRDYTIKTASNGVAIFDVDVPEVAGAIFVMAGTDIGPEDEAAIDGQYFEHWGYKMYSVAPEEFLDLVVSPESYLTDIPLDLSIELWNEDETKDILEASSLDKAVNITLEGEDMTGEITLASQPEFTVNEIRYYEATADEWYIDEGAAFQFADAEIVVIRGKTTGISFGIEDYSGVTITEFSAAEVGDITITACSDLGGVGSIASIDSPLLPDGGADYLDTGAKIISVSAPGDMNIVEIATDPDPLQVSFDALPDGTEVPNLLSNEIDLKVYDSLGEELETDVSFTASGVRLADEISATYDVDRWVVTVYPLEAGNLTLTAKYDTDLASATYKVYGLMVDVIPTTLSSTVDYYDVNVTVTTIEGLTLSIVGVQLQQGGEAIDYLGAVKPGDPVGLYRFNISAIQVGAEWEDAIQAVVGIELASALGDYTAVGNNFGGDMITISYDILDVELDRGNVTSLIDQDVVVAVTEEGTPIEGANVYADGCEYENELIGTTDSEGEATFEFDGQTGITIGTITLRAVAEDLTKTGSIELTVLKPELMLYNLTVNDHISNLVTAGLDAFLNATVLDGDGYIGLTDDVEISVSPGLDLGLFFNASSDQTGLVEDGEEVGSEKLLLAPEGYAVTKIPKASTATDAFAAYELFEFKICDDSDDAYPSTVPSGGANLFSVYNLTISPPIVSNTTYSGFPVKYTAFVGQSKNFYLKIQDADGVPVQGANIAIMLDSVAASSGVTDSSGETTITWEPSATGTFDLRLNGVLDIGIITIESYVAPQLVIDYSPKPVYLDNVVTINVTADGELVVGAWVSIVDPDGITIERTTTGAGTCTFTPDVAGDWIIYAECTGYTFAVIEINVLELAPITDISLSVGWNLVSLPLIPDDSDIEVVLAGLEGFESVWTYYADTWYSYSPGAPSDLNDMVDGYGYWISMSASATLTVTGTEMPVDPFDPLPAYPVVEGWNLVGFKSTSTMTVSEYLLGVEYVRVYEYVEGYNSLSANDYMMPGRGYWIAASEAGTIYP